MAYCALMRLDKPVGIWLTFFPASWAALLAAHTYATHDIVKILLLLLLGALLTRSAGCIINDLIDKDLDAQVARTKTRPLVAQRVSMREAIGLLILLLLGALLLACALPRMVLYLSLLTAPMIAVYPLMKRYINWPQAFLGLTFNMSALMGWAAVTHTLAAPALWLYVGAIAWTFGYDTIYAHQDIEDDRRVGIKSSARALDEASPRAIAFSYALFCLCLLAAGISGQATQAYYWAVCAASLHLLWQIYRFSMQDRAGAARLFLSNVTVGACLFIGTATSLYVKTFAL